VALRPRPNERVPLYCAHAPRALPSFPTRRSSDLTKAHPVLAREAVLFEQYTALLAKSVDSVLRRHGKNIAEMQYTQSDGYSMSRSEEPTAGFHSLTNLACRILLEENTSPRSDPTT